MLLPTNPPLIRPDRPLPPVHVDDDAVGTFSPTQVDRQVPHLRATLLRRGSVP